MKTLIAAVVALLPFATLAETQLYWGDLHVRSNRSPDSFAFGNSRLTPDAAFRFAKGRKILANSGSQVQLRRPLDFLLVAENAEFHQGVWYANIAFAERHTMIANLDRMQVIKGYLSGSGELKECTHDVAFAGDRQSRES